MDSPSISSSSAISSSAASVLSQEIVECTEADEILEVVTEEAELLTGPAAVLAMHQLALCPREQHAALRGSQPFAQLLALLERHSPSLGPKVPTSTLPVPADDESAHSVSALAALQEYDSFVAAIQENCCWFCAGLSLSGADT